MPFALGGTGNEQALSLERESEVQLVAGLTFLTRKSAHLRDNLPIAQTWQGDVPAEVGQVNV